jgi:hypothetical protein
VDDRQPPSPWLDEIAEIPFAQMGSARGRMSGVSEPTEKYSIPTPRDIAEAARARGGSSGRSSYGAVPVARHIERGNLDEIIAAAEAEHGPISDEEIQARRELLQRDRR